MGRIVELPLGYTVHGIPPRAQNARTIEVLDFVPVEIREVPPSDLKPVLSFPKADQEEVYGAFEGNLYVSGGHRLDRTVDMVLDRARKLRDAVSGGRETVVPSPLDQIMDKRSYSEDAIMHEEVHRLRDVSFNDEERRRGRFAARVEKLLIVDGELLVPVPEPTWSPRETARGAEVQLQRGLPPSNLVAFRFDRRAEAIEYARHAWRREPEVLDFGVEVVGDWKWGFDEIPHGNAILRSIVLGAWTLQDAPNQSALRNAPPEFFLAMCGVRDAQDDASRVAAVNALETVLENLPPNSALRKHMLKPISIWTWSRRALPDRRDEPSADDLGDLRI